MHPNAVVEVLKLTLLFIPCFDFLKYKMMCSFIHFGIEEISIIPCMDTSVCRSCNAITVCKYGKSSCHSDCFIIPGKANKSILSCC